MGDEETKKRSEAALQAFIAIDQLEYDLKQKLQDLRNLKGKVCLAINGRHQAGMNFGPGKFCSSCGEEM